MSQIKRILVPTDFTKSADAALWFTANLTKDFPDKEVTFIHVLAKGSESVGAKLMFLKQEFESLSDASCKTTYVEGDLTDAIVKFQKENEQDLIVMGTEVNKEDLSYGSKMVLEADCPVLLIPSSHSSGIVRNIALAIDQKIIDDSCSLNVLHALARERDAKIHVLTVINENERYQVVPNANMAILEYYLETLDYKYVFPKNSDIEQGINGYIEENAIDLLAILPRVHDTKSEPSKGLLTQVLTQHASVPILAID